MAWDKATDIDDPVPSLFASILRHGKPGDKIRDFAETHRGELPLLDLAAKIPAGPKAYHSGSTLDHMARCMNETAGDPLAVWMAFCHDAGKLTTPAAMLPHHYNHENRGGELIKLWVKRLRLPESWFDAADLACRLHMKAGMYPRLRPGKKLSLLEEIFATPYGDAFWKVVDADTKGGISARILPLWQEFNKLKARLDQADQILLIKRLSQDYFSRGLS